MSKAFTSKPVSAAAALLLSALTMAACGSGGGSGSGGDSGGGTTVTTAEGFWAGPTTITTNEATPRRATMAGSVLENGDYWFLLDVGGEIFKLVYGKGTSTSGTFASAPNIQTPLQANYVAKTSLRGTGEVTINNSRGPYQYELAYDATYEQPPGFNIAGTDWVGTLPLSVTPPFNTPVSIQITGSGNLSGVFSQDCRIDGTLLPRSGSKRIYNASLTVSCTSGSAKYTGVAEPASNQGGALKQRVLIKAIDDATQTFPLVILVDR